MLKPMNTKLLVELDIPEEKTAGGLIIPESQRKNTTYGVVLAIGPDVKEVEENDRILYENFAGIPFKIDGKDCVILDIKNILAKV